MINEKMANAAANNSAVREMFEEGKRLKARFGEENVFDFSLGNPYFPPPTLVKDSIVEILETLDPLDVHGYMANDGYPAVRETIAQHLSARYGDTLTGDELIMTVGAAGGMNIILKTLLNPGDEVLVPAPYFLEYGHYVSNYGGVLLSVPSREETGFQLDIPAIAAAITPRTKALLLNNPNNPTGAVYSADTVAALAAVLDQKQAEYGAPIYLISDEPYRELVYDGVQVPYLPKFYRNTIVCYSWSKSLSLPGERIGYLQIPSRIDDYPLIRQAASICGRILGFVNAPSLMQHVVARCIGASCDISAYDANRRALYEGLTALGYTCQKPEGAFYLWLKSPEPDERAFVERAKAHNILVVPGGSFNGSGYVRMAYCVSPQTIHGSMKGFAAMAEEYGLGKSGNEG